jgi:hypothetical protein
MRHLLSITAVLIAGFLYSQAQAGPIYNAGTLAFKSDDQSMWAPGDALVKSGSTFVGTQWGQTELKTATIGGIVGSENTVVFPSTGAIVIPFFEPRIWIPTPTWSNLFKGYWTGCGCVKDVTIKPATNAITADTRTGAKLDVHTKGKAGLEFGYSIESGSVDTNANFEASAELPDEIKADEFFSLTTSSAFVSGIISTQSPKAEAYISAIMELSGSVDAKACALTFGCETGSFNLPTIDLDQRILSIDPNSLKVLDGVLPGGEAFAEVSIFNQSLTLKGGATAAPPVVGFKLTGPGGTLVSSLPPTPAVTVDLAEFTVQAPDIATDGTGSGSKVTSTGRDDLLSAQLDIDGAATLFAGLPPFGIGVDLIDAGPFKLSVSLDLIDVDAGPVIGVTQDFEFTPTLKVSLAFSNPIKIDGLTGQHTAWEGLWSNLPKVAITQDTIVIPTFWLDALLETDMGLDLGLVGTLDILKLGATGSIGSVDFLNFNPISLNNLLGIDNELFSTDKLGLSVYKDSFKLGGFNSIVGQDFLLAVIVPEPGVFCLLITGFGFLLLGRFNRSRTSRARIC